MGLDQARLAGGHGHRADRQVLRADEQPDEHGAIESPDGVGGAQHPEGARLRRGPDQPAEQPVVGVDLLEIRTRRAYAPDVPVAGGGAKSSSTRSGSSP